MSPRVAAVLLALAPALGVAVAAPAPDKKADEQELQRLQGDWKTVPTERDGKAEPENNLHGIRIVIRGESAWLYLGLDGPPSEKWRWSLGVDPSRSPKVFELDMRGTWSVVGRVRGIYQLEEGRLLLRADLVPEKCEEGRVPLHHGAKQLPGDIWERPKKGVSPIILTLKRIKK